MAKLEVRHSTRFAGYLEELRRKAAENEHGFYATVRRGIERNIDLLIADSNFAFLRDSGLGGEPFDLVGARRVKVNRGRLFYVASSAKNLAIVLHFSELRRGGDRKRDAYAEFAKLLRSGEFDQHFQDLGIERPSGKRTVR